MHARKNHIRTQFIQQNSYGFGVIVIVRILY